jgi:hypothetical protein
MAVSRNRAVVSIDGLLSRKEAEEASYLSGTTIADKHELEGRD